MTKSEESYALSIGEIPIPDYLLPPGIIHNPSDPKKISFSGNFDIQTVQTEGPIFENYVGIVEKYLQSNYGETIDTISEEQKEIVYRKYADHLMLNFQLLSVFNDLPNLPRANGEISHPRKTIHNDLRFDVFLKDSVGKKIASFHPMFTRKNRGEHEEGIGYDAQSDSLHHIDPDIDRNFEIEVLVSRALKGKKPQDLIQMLFDVKQQAEIGKKLPILIA